MLLITSQGWTETIGGQGSGQMAALARPGNVLLKCRSMGDGTEGCERVPIKVFA